LLLATWTERGDDRARELTSERPEAPSSNAFAS
jgi:hypothetical protein